MRTGRPTKYRKDFPERAERLFSKGATSAEVSKALKVQISTLYDWADKKPEFSEAVRRGKAVADELMEQALFKRGVGFSHPDTHFSSYEGEITATSFTRHYPPDTNACIFWLKNRKPKEWRDAHDLSVTTLNGMPEDLVKAIQDRAAEKAKTNGSTHHAVPRT